MSDPDTSIAIQECRLATARAVDVVSHSLVLVCVIVVWPDLLRDRLMRVNLFYEIPLAGLLYGVFRLPQSFRVPRLSLLIWRLRFVALTAAGLSPFVAWYMNSPASVYLLCGGVAAVLTFLWTLFLLLVALQEIVGDSVRFQMLPHSSHAQRLPGIPFHWFVRIGRRGLAVAMAAFCGMHLSQALRVSNGGVPEGMLGASIWETAPSWLLILVFLPVFLAVFAIWDSRVWLSAIPQERWRAIAAAPPPPHSAGDGT